MVRNPVLGDCVWVVKHSDLVSINQESIGKMADSLLSREILGRGWDDVEYFEGTPEEVAMYVLVLEAMNFMSWHPDQEKTWFYESIEGWWSGWYGVVHAVNDDIKKNGTRLLDPNVLEKMSYEMFCEVFARRGEMLFVEERLRNLVEIGRVVNRVGDGSYLKVIEECEYDAMLLLDRLVKEFGMFRDVAMYQGREVRFYKRVQHHIACLWKALEEAGGKEMRNVDGLTAFADQTIARVLRHFGVLEYVPALAVKVDEMVLLESGGKEEVEIRAAEVVAMDWLREELASKGRKMNTITLDVNVWAWASSMKEEMLPGHRVMSEWY